MDTHSLLGRALCACARAALKRGAFVVGIAVLCCVPAATVAAQSTGPERVVATTVPLPTAQVPTWLQPATDWFASGSTRTVVTEARPEIQQTQAAAPAEEDRRWQLDVVGGYEHKKQHLESKSSYTKRTFYPPGRQPVEIVEEEVAPGTEFIWRSNTPFVGAKLSAPPTEHLSFSVLSNFYFPFEELTVNSSGFDVNAVGVSGGVVFNLWTRRGENGWQGQASYEFVKYLSDSFNRQTPYGASQGVTTTRDEILVTSRHENRVTFLGGYKMGNVYAYGTMRWGFQTIEIDSTIEGQGPPSTGAIPFTIASKDGLRTEQPLWGGGGVEIPIGAGFMLRTEILTNGDGITFDLGTEISLPMIWFR